LSFTKDGCVGLAIPTVLITAYPDERIRLRALRAGVVCYLVKPIAEEDFLDCIRSASATLGWMDRADVDRR